MEMLAIGLLLGLVILGLSWKNPIYFLVAQILGRFVLDSLPQYTYVVSMAGLTVMQLFTVANISFMAVYLTLKAGWTFSRITLPIGLMIFIVALSAIVNQKLLGFAELGTKWIYLWLLAEYILYTLRKNAPGKVLGVLFACYLYPLLNQLVQMAIGAPKVDAVGVSYLGTFDHESTTAFLLMGLVSISMVLWMKSSAKTIKIIALLTLIMTMFGIYMNNYRTALPALGVFLLISYYYTIKSMPLSKKVIMNSVFFMLVGGVVVYLGSDISAKLGDIGYVVTHLGDLLDFSGHAERTSLLSGRIYILNQYMHYFLEGGIESKVIGLGPRAGNELIGVYAHNEYLSSLVEYGILGLAAFVYFLVVSTKYLRRSIHFDPSLYPLYAMFLGFLIMALGTMPFHDPRALIFLSIVFAFAFDSEKKRVLVESDSRKNSVLQHKMVDRFRASR